MTTAPLSLAAFSSELADLVERTSRLVVSVDGRPRRPASGLVFGQDLIVTADHVLERDEDIIVRAGDERHAATVAGRDAGADVAVLRVPGLRLTEPAYADDVRPGAFVVSIARTAAGGISAGAGVVAAVGGPLRTGRGTVLRQIIRTDAAARPGTSGGAIVDASARVIGMTTSGLLRGLPVAIPSAQLREIATALASGVVNRRAYLGVSVQPVRLPPRQHVDGADGGLLILGVATNGAADRAGLLVGDVIVGFHDRRLEHADDLQDRLAQLEAGATVSVDVIRGAASTRIAVTTDERPTR